MLSVSIKWRLQSWYMLILAVLLAGFAFTAWRLQRDERLRQIDDELYERSFLLTGAVRPPSATGAADDPEFKLPAHVASLFDAVPSNKFYFAIWLRDGSMQKHSANAPPDVPMPARESAEMWHSVRMRGTMREFFRFTTSDRCILIGRSIELELAELDRLGRLLTWAGGAVLLFGLAGGWWAAARAIKPLEDMIATAGTITDPSQRISTPEKGGELGRLAAVLNSTLERLEAAFARQKQFTGDAAHELRTPITVIISETQTVLAREREPAEYRESLETCLTAAQQMRRLTESLLQLARSDSGQEQLPRTEIDLASLAQDCAAYVVFHAQKNHVKVFPDLAPARICGIEDQMRQVITNLLTNAIDYNRPYGQVHLSTVTQNGCAIVTVRDSGQGIAEGDLPHIFDRFYRTDQARSRAAGRSGLGLPICEAIVEAHGGKIEAASTVGEGTTFTVRFPAK